MFRLWLDGSIPAKSRAITEGHAELIGPGAPMAQLAECDGAIAGGSQFNGAFMDQGPRLKVIARLGVGYENLDVRAATQRGIIACYAPEAPTISTAEHTIALMMAVAKHIRQYDEHTRAGTIRSYRPALRGMELHGRTLGLVGAGRIGSRVATVARALGMTVVVFDPFLNTQRASEIGVRLAPTLEACLSESDVVSLHAPATEETKNLMNSITFGQMKQGAILINAARGSLVDESALVDALTSGHLGGAGLDVFQVEPPKKEHPLLMLETVVVTPHIASATEVGILRLWESALTQALQVLHGERPPHMLNPEIWPSPSR